MVLSARDARVFYNRPRASAKSLRSRWTGIKFYFGASPGRGAAPMAATAKAYTIKMLYKAESPAMGISPTEAVGASHALEDVLPDWSQPGPQ